MKMDKEIEKGRYIENIIEDMAKEYNNKKDLNLKWELPLHYILRRYLEDESYVDIYERYHNIEQEE